MPWNMDLSESPPSLGRPLFTLVCALSVALAGTSLTAAPPTEQQKQVDRAVVRALEYLAKQQQPSGAWKSESHGEMTSITSLAIMAFMAAGHVPGEGPYKEQMDRGIRWVIAEQKADGLLVNRNSQPMYCHGISTLMLAEVVGMVSKEDARPVRHALEKGVKLILSAQAVPKQDTQAGGWRYQATSSDSDLSVTGWQLLALRAAKNAGCDVPAESIDKAVAYVKRCSTRDHRGFGYQPGGGPTAVRSGTGILALEICGEHHAAESLGAADYFLQFPMRPGESFYFYGVYYCGVGMFQIGGRHWEKMRDLLYEQLLPAQTEDGSWLAVNQNERGVGRNYATSMAVLSLAVEYQYLPIYQR